MAWHYTPQRSLERWVIPADPHAGSVWRYERGESKPRPIPPARAAAESYLYAPDSGPEAKDRRLEEWLSKNIDGPGSACIDKLIAGSRLSESEKDTVALYFGFQAARVPRVRDAVLEFATALAHQELQQFASQERKAVVSELLRLDESIEESQVDDFIERARRGGPFFVEASNVIWLHRLQADGRRIAAAIRHLPWKVVHAPEDVEFVSSDNPVATGTPPTYQGRIHPGWGVAGVEHTLPLDPKHVLFVAQHAVGENITNLAQWCRDVVYRTCRQAQRYVFARTQSRRIGWFLAEPML